MYAVAVFHMHDTVDLEFYIKYILLEWVVKLTCNSTCKLLISFWHKWLYNKIEYSKNLSQKYCNPSFSELQSRIYLFLTFHLIYPKLNWFFKKLRASFIKYDSSKKNIQFIT